MSISASVDYGGTQWPPKSKFKNTFHILKTSSIRHVFQVTETFLQRETLSRIRNDF